MSQLHGYEQSLKLWHEIVAFLNAVEFVEKKFVGRKIKDVAHVFQKEIFCDVAIDLFVLHLSSMRRSKLVQFFSKREIRHVTNKTCSPRASVHFSSTAIMRS